MGLQRDLVPTCRELGIAFLAYSPLGRGMLTANFSPSNLAETDFRRKTPRFAKEALEQVRKQRRAGFHALKAVSDENISEQVLAVSAKLSSGLQCCPVL